jgi:hypothetical protein
MSAVSSDLAVLLERCGRFGGHGIDHDDQPLYGELELQPLPAGQGVWLTFRASGIDGSLLHDERSWVAFDAEGRLCLWTVSTLAEGVRHHVRRHGVAPAGIDTTLVFGSGDPGDERVHRVELAIDLWPDGALGYRSAWGLPGGDFRPRSQVRMEREP